MRLALTLGYLDVNALLQSISGKQLTEWMAFFELEPFGQEWMQTGMITAMIANVNRDAKKRSEPFQPTDFIPGYRKPPEDPEAVARKIEAYFMTLANHDDPQTPTPTPTPSPSPNPKPGFGEG